MRAPLLQVADGDAAVAAAPLRLHTHTLWPTHVSVARLDDAPLLRALAAAARTLLTRHLDEASDRDADDRPVFSNGRLFELQAPRSPAAPSRRQPGWPVTCLLGSASRRRVHVSMAPPCAARHLAVMRRAAL